MSRSLRIAAADDESGVRDYFKKMLLRLGHEMVSAAKTGRELVEHCRVHHPDLIITEINMPDFDGIDAAYEIYAEHPIPVILVSASMTRN